MLTKDFGAGASWELGEIYHLSAVDFVYHLSAVDSA